MNYEKEIEYCKKDIEALQGKLEYLEKRQPKKKCWVAIAKEEGEITRILVRLPKDIFHYVNENNINFDEIIVSFSPKNSHYGISLSPNEMLSFYSNTEPVLEIEE